MSANVVDLTNDNKCKYLLSSYMEHSQDIWFIKDTESRYVYMNDVALDFYNVPKNFDVIGKLDNEIPLAPNQEFWREFVKHDQKAMEEHKKISTLQIHYDGNTPISHFCDKTPFYDDNKKCIGVVCHAKKLDTSELLYYMSRLNKDTVELDAPNNIFTRRELEISFWVQQRLSSKEIAKKLNISHRTVENKLRTIHQKAKVNTTRQFIEYCKVTGLDNYVPSELILKGVQLVY